MPGKKIKKAPVGIAALLEVGMLWAIVIGISLKFWIGMSGAHYTVATGEEMIDMFDRIL